MYCSEDINRVTDSGKARLVGEHLYGDLCSIIKELYREYEVSSTYAYSDDVEGYDCAIGGYYDHEMVQNNVIIELLVSSNTSTVRIIEDEWEDFAFLLSQTLQHELIHRHQYDIRFDDCITTRHEFIGKVLEDREYYAEDDEIDAYGHCIALELKRRYSDKRIRQVLSNPRKIRGCPSWDSYKKAFGQYKNWVDVRQALLKKIWKWLPTAAPYKEK